MTTAFSILKQPLETTFSISKVILSTLGILWHLMHQTPEQTGLVLWLVLLENLGSKGVINGNAGSDTIQLSNRSEAFFLHDAYSDFHESVTLNADNHGMLAAKRITNIENILAGGGDDIIDLTSPDYLVDLNGIQIYGESGDDVLWGANNDEHLNGGSGDDVLFGGSGDDHFIWGAMGSMFLDLQMI